MEVSRSYRDLKVWQRAIDLSIEIYKLKRSFPKDELYGLVSQMRRASVSVPSNIADGQGRQSLGDFKRFINIAIGSLAELHTQLLIACRLAYIDREAFGKLEGGSHGDKTNAVWIGREGQILNPARSLLSTAYYYYLLPTLLRHE